MPNAGPNQINSVADPKKFGKFFGVSLVGTGVDYVLALMLFEVFGVPGLIATSLAFVAGAIVNYIGHASVTFRQGSAASISVTGLAKYIWAAGVSLLVRLAVVFLLQMLAVQPFWFALACAFAASFLTSYLISALWVFRRTD